MPNKILSMLNLLKDIIVAPKRVFQKINENQLSFEVYIVFSIGAFVTFLKTLRLESQRIHVFETEKINEALSLLSVPQIKWVFTYIGFFLFIFMLFIFSRILFKRASIKSLFLCIMSISGIGLLLQAVFFLFHYVLPSNINFFLTHIAFAWVVLISLLAIKYSQDISIAKSLVLFVIAGLPTIFFAGLPGISPYLSWLNL